MSAQSNSIATSAVDYAAADNPARPAWDFFENKRTTLKLDNVPVPFVNGRTLSPTLENEGVMIGKHKTSITLDDPIEEIYRVYFAEMCAYLKDLTGADVVIPQGMRGLMIRRPPAGDRPFYLQMKGTRIAHLDFTQKSFDKWRNYAISQAGIDPGKCRRVVAMQTWRMMVNGPQDESLAVMDARTYTRATDQVVTDSIISNDDSETFEIVGIKPNPKHRWMIWPDLTPEEPMLFKGWDTDDRFPSDVPHQAATNPWAGPNPVPRQSIESRFYCFYR